MTRKNIIKAIQKQHGIPYFIAEDITDNLESEIAEYLDGNHKYDSLETLIKQYVSIPHRKTEEIVNALLY